MKKEVINLFKQNNGRSFKAKEIAGRLGITEPEEYSSLKMILHKLVEEGTLGRQGKRYRLSWIPEGNKVTGTFLLNPGGFGFVVPKNGNTGDIFIASRNTGTAFHGDKVEVILFAKQKGKNLEGHIVKVIKRKREEIVGTLEKSRSFYFVKPDDPLIHRDIYIDPERLNGARKGDKVIAGKIVWDSSMLNPEGEILEVLGKSGSRKTEVVSIAREFNLPFAFSPGVIEETEKLSDIIPEEEILNRTDFREKVVFTIDPEDAKDFDDALSIEKLPGGNFSVGIHIADVSHYVKINSALDKEALKRGNSVYLVGQVIPMLPEKLSNEICSLKPDQDRLTCSVIVEITGTAKVVGYRIEKTIIRSKRRFTYEEVQKILESGEGEFAGQLNQLNKIARQLRRKRVKEGSIEFFTPEVKFVLDKEGKPLDVIKKEIRESNMLVEEFMLLANKIVAKDRSDKTRKSALPFVFRIHDLPDEQKVIEFARFVKSLGYSFSFDKRSKSAVFQRLIEQVRGKEEEAVINELAIRSMAKAEYSVNNIGHFGLGFKFYTHFTSPIRRYSDLIVHRLIFDGSGKNNYSYKQLESVCEHISTTERIAIDAERYSVKLKQTEYLKDHIGEEFHAVISGVAHFGIFVELTDILAEGLIRVKDLEGDFYVYDDKKYALIGRASRKQYRLGDKVLVKLIRVDQDKNELDFIITE
ncbi:MAG: ribonuclease R [Ignavibacteriaceae bacterium]